MDIKVCDQCNKELRQRASYLVVQREMLAPSIGDDLTSKDFCNETCIKNYIELVGKL